MLLVLLLKTLSREVLRLHKVVGKSVPVIDHPHFEEFLLNISLRFLLLQCGANASHLFAVHL